MQSSISSFFKSKFFQKKLIKCVGPAQKRSAEEASVSASVTSSKAMKMAIKESPMKKVVVTKNPFSMMEEKKEEPKSDQ